MGYSANDDEDWDDEDWDDEDWDDEDWDDEDWDDEDQVVDQVKPAEDNKQVQLHTPAAEAQDLAPSEAKESEQKAKVTEETKVEEAAPEVVAEPNSVPEPVDPKMIQQQILSEKFSRPIEDIEAFYSLYSSQLNKLDARNPRELVEIEKLVEIVGMPKASQKRLKPTVKKAKKDDPIINFSARSISVRDAFATIARMSGKSITVSGKITDRDTISVVEINDQPFTSAFLSLVESSGVDFSTNEDNYVILKKRGGKDISLLSALDHTDIDTSLPLDQRYADLSYDNQDLSAIIKDVANKYGVDVVMTATPTERITLRVRGVSIEEAFKLLFSGSKFKYTRQDDTFIVYSGANKDFALDRKTVFFPLKYLEANEASKLLPQDLKGIVKVSENQNALIAEASKEDLTKLFEFLRTIDKPIPQVELDVKLVEVSKRDGKQITPYQSAFSIGRIGDAAAAVTGLNSADFGLDEMGVFQNRPTAQFSSSLSKIKVSQRLLVASGKSAKINFDEDINVVLNAASGGGGNQFVGQTQRITRITAGNSMDITPIVGGVGVGSGWPGEGEIDGVQGS